MKSQFDGRRNRKQNCFSQYSKFDCITRNCAICSVEQSCQKTTVRRVQSISQNSRQWQEEQQSKRN